MTVFWKDDMALLKRTFCRLARISHYVLTFDHDDGPTVRYRSEPLQFY